MGKVKFYVRSKTSTTNATVYYNISISKNDRLTGKTDVTVNPKQWDNIIQLVDVSKTTSKKKATADNTKLLEFEDFINNKLIELKSKPNIASIKLELKKGVEVYYGRIKLFENKSTPTLFEYFDEFETKLKLDGKSHSVIVGYRRLKELLLDFQHKQKTNLSYESIIDNFYLEFIQYLKKKQPIMFKNRFGNTKIKKAYGTNAQGTTIKRLSAIMNQSFNSQYHTNPSYKNFKKPHEKVFAIYLNEDEISELRVLNLNKKDGAVRDYFDLMCLSGLRISDALNLTIDNIKVIDGVPMIVYKQMKGKKIHAVKISMNIQNILDKYDGGFPNEQRNIKINDEYLNKTIKKLGKVAGINTMVKGKPKHDWIFSHSGRRSASTNAFLNGMPIWKIRISITNHATDSQTEDYIKAENPEIIAHFSNKKINQHERI